MNADEELTLAHEDGARAVPEREEAPATQSALPSEVASQLIGILDDYVAQLKAGKAPS